MRGYWIDNNDSEITNENPSTMPWRSYFAAEDPEVHLVRSDGLRRIFKFKKNSEISIGPMMLEFDQEDVIDELSVDENKQAGN